MEMKDLVKTHEDFIRGYYQHSQNSDLIPQIVFCVKGKVYVILITGEGDSREGIKKIIESVENNPLEWLIFMNEGYMEALPKRELPPNYEHGSLEKRFKAGDKAVKEITILQVYKKGQKMMITYDRKTMTKLSECDEFDGYLTVSDVARVFWE
jgi:hypothetical protein